MEDTKTIEMAVSIVAANAYGRGFLTDELSGALKKLTGTLKDLAKTDAVEISQTLQNEEILSSPALPVSWKKSITLNAVTCLICGAKTKVLAPHLKRSHQMTTKDYRKQFGIPAKVGLTSLSVRKKRSQTAKDKDLGGKLREYRERKKKG
jgi:predicted transcriptional regulator